MQAVAQRNENVAVQRIDNNVAKEAGIRTGNQTTLITEAPPESNFYAVEFGQPVQRGPFLAAVSKVANSHAELFWQHQNSVFNARTFFQVGAVQPSRRNLYGGRFTTEASRIGYLTFNFGQRKIRGMVNGNVLVPLADERTPLAADPAVRAVVQRFLDAFPDTLPNRPDFDPRALNTNAPQTINEIDGTLRLDRSLGKRGNLAFSHTLLRSHTDAFQLVAGQNPDSDIHSHRSQATWRGSLNGSTDAEFGVTFQRVRSLLKPEPNAVGPRVRFGFQIEELGPDSEFPVNRALNTFRYGAQFSHRAGGSHTLIFGGDVLRTQLNGQESNNERGFFVFSVVDGRSSIENFRRGLPAFYEITMGDLYRGYRNWIPAAYAGDRWRIHPRLQASFGVRFNAVTNPTEVNGFPRPGFACDCNNFAPRMALAWQAPRQWVARAYYGISFGDIQPVTWQQTRNNLPHARYIQIQSPDLLNPLRDLRLDEPNPRSSPTYLAPDLVSPYARQYGLTLERRLKNGTMIRAGYIGSRSFKLMNSFIFNRAVPVDGIPLTLATVDLRRPDPRFYEVRHIVNAGIAYLDAVQGTIDLPVYKGFRGGVSYTFGKAIDEGPDYTATAANRDLSRGRSQSQYEVLKDKKALSNFDSTHGFQFFFAYDVPGIAQKGGWMSSFVNGWQVSGVSLWKSGTPSTLYIGSDAPGIGNVDGGPSDRPNILDPSILGRTISHPDIAPQILRRDRFDYIHPGDLRGSLGRNTFRKATIANMNVALTKEWHMGTRREWSAQLRCEAFNLTNTPQFDEPQRNLSSPSFGRITNTLNDGRVLQLGLRLSL